MNFSADVNWKSFRDNFGISNGCKNVLACFNIQGMVHKQHFNGFLILFPLPL